MRTAVSLAVCVLLVSAALPARSQPAADSGPPPVPGVPPGTGAGPGLPPPMMDGPPPVLPLGDMQESDVREMIEMVMMAKLSRELELSDDETVLMMRRFSETKERVSELIRERSEAVKALKQILDQDAAEDELRAALDKLMALDKELRETRVRVFDQASADLSLTQQARLYLFINEFDDQIRKLVMRARTRHHAPGEFGDRGEPGDALPGMGRGLGEGRGGFGGGFRRFNPEAPAPSPEPSPEPEEKPEPQE